MNIHFEMYVARYYQNKVKNARRDGYEFDLSLISVRNMLAAKKCFYTGWEMTLPEFDHHGVPRPNYAQRPTDVTIDRVDHTKGYVKGNVVACCRAANSFKARLENDTFELSCDDMITMASKLQKWSK